MINLTERLEKTLGKAATHDKHILARAVCKAIDSARFNFGLEPVHTLDKSSKTDGLPMEYLLRPSGTDGKTLDLTKGLHTLRNIGLSSIFDMIVVPKAIEQAISYGNTGLPISVNIAPESMNDSLFLTELSSYLNSLKLKIDNPANVVLEIQFAGHTTNEAQSWMRQIQEMGYRVAVDNFGKHDPLELEAIGRIEPAFVKVEGKIIFEALSGVVGAPSKLRQIVDGVRKFSPDSKIIAPWVASIKQAQRLHQVYRIDAVQGRELPKDRTYFSSQWALMAYSDESTLESIN